MINLVLLNQIHYIKETMSGDQSTIVLVDESGTPVASNAPLNIVLDEPSQTGEKRKQETDSNVDEQNKCAKTEPKDDTPYYVDFKYLTKDVMKQCIEFSRPMVIEGKITAVWINFNYRKFAELKEIKDNKVAVVPIKKRIYSTSPWLKTAFGYSPYISDDGKIQNQLRLTFANSESDYIDEDGKKFEDLCREWDEFFIEAIHEHRDDWPVKNVLKIKSTQDLDIQVIKNKYQPLVRPSKDDYPPYLSLKFETQKADKKNNIKEDKTKARVFVWNAQKELVAQELTDENSVPKDDKDREGKKIIVDKYHFLQTIFFFQKIYFSNSEFGPNLCVDTIMFDEEENLRNARKDVNREVCPF